MSSNAEAKISDSNRSSVDDGYVEAWGEIWAREESRLRAKYGASSNDNQQQSDGTQSDSEMTDSTVRRRNVLPIPQQMLRLKVLERENASYEEENLQLKERVCELKERVYELKRELQRELIKGIRQDRRVCELQRELHHVRKTVCDHREQFKKTLPEQMQRLMEENLHLKRLCEFQLPV